MIKKYQVLGVKGNKVEINGKEYEARVDVIELTDEEAAQPLSESKIALFSGESSTTNAPSEESQNSSDENKEEDEGDENESEEDEEDSDDDDDEIKEGEEK